MSRWKVILAVIIIFAAGAATGGMLVRTYAPKIVKRTQYTPGPPFPSTKAYLDRLDRELRLTPEQRTKIEAILVQSQGRVRKLWEPISPAAREEYKRTRKEISEVLDEQQREKMKRWRRDREPNRDKKEENLKIGNNPKPEV